MQNDKGVVSESMDVSPTSSESAVTLVLSNGSLPGDIPFEERVSAAKAAGFDGIGIASWEYARLRGLGHTDADLLAILADHDMVISELEVVLGYAVPPADRGIEPLPGLSYTDPDALAQLFAIADTFQIPRMQAAGTFGTSVLEPNAGEAFGTLCDRAAEHNLSVALEFVPVTNVPDARTALQIVTEADRPNGGICVDSWHHFRGTKDLDALKALPAERIVMIQLDDGPATPADPDFLADTTQNREPLGAGDFDLHQFLGTLWDQGAQATPLSIEVMSTRLNTQSPRETAALLAAGARDVVRSLRDHPVQA